MKNLPNPSLIAPVKEHLLKALKDLIDQDQFKQNLIEKILSPDNTSIPMDNQAIATFHGECQLIAEQATKALDKLPSVDQSTVLYRGTTFPKPMAKNARSKQIARSWFS